MQSLDLGILDSFVCNHYTWMLDSFVFNHYIWGYWIVLYAIIRPGDIV